MSGTSPSSRDRMLGFLRLRAPSGRAADLFALSGDGHVRIELAPADRRARFAAALRKVGGEVHDLVGAADPRRALLEVLVGLKPAGDGSTARPRAAIDRDPAWARLAARLPLEEMAREAGFEMAPLPADGPGVLNALAGAALGLTLADHGIAETGSIAQFARPWRPRSISLLPPAHLVILPEDRIRADLEELLALAGPDLAGAGYLTLITGPSRTADIEKVLTIGVHGPGRLAVAVVGALGD